MVARGRIHEVKQAAHDRLLIIPGVHAVGVGPKRIGGKSTGELSIKVYLVAKRPLAEVAAAELVPPEIDGFKTDVEQMPVPRLHFDTDKARPLVSGVGIMAKRAPERGTMGFYAHTGDVPPKLVVVTNQHVVAPPVAKTATDFEAVLTGTNPQTITMVGTSTLGMLIVVKMFSPSTNKALNVYWTSGPNASPQTVAEGVRDALNAFTAANVTATVTTPEQVDIVTNIGADTVVKAASVYDPAIPDPNAQLIATVSANAITFTGTMANQYGIFTSWNTNSSNPTAGSFVAPNQDTALSDVASAVAGAINTLNISGITASAAGATVTIAGAGQVICQVTSDIRVGQPTDGFSSNCSLCCTDEIGRVIASRIDVDVALVQLRQGLKYMLEVKGDDTQTPHVPDTLVTGVYFVTDQDAQASLPVNKRGAATLYTKGTVASINNFGYTVNTPPTNDWTVFYRFYNGVMFVDGVGGAPFSDQGDSGSPVFNATGEIVGLLFGGSTHGLVTPIETITDTFGITLPTAAALGQTQTVTVAEGALAMVGVNDDQIAREVFAAQAEISATPAGKEYATLVRRHAQEVQTLVNTNRRVATAWHRNGGPKMVEAVVDYVRKRDEPVAELEGVALTDRLRNIEKALRRHGSPELVRDLEQFGPEILSLTSLSYSQALRRMGELRDGR